MNEKTKQNTFGFYLYRFVKNRIKKTNFSIIKSYSNNLNITIIDLMKFFQYKLYNQNKFKINEDEIQINLCISIKFKKKEKIQSIK